MRNLIVLSILLFSNILGAQITKVSLDLQKDASTKLYDVFLVVEEGQTNKTIDRVQFNTQISIAVSTGSTFELIKSYMPLKDNQNYKGTSPMNWLVDKPLIAPAAAPGLDFYSITPELIPTSLYNDLKQGDRVKLFSLDVKLAKGSVIRFYEDSDPDENMPGMMGRDFSISICIGGVANDYIK